MVQLYALYKSEEWCELFYLIEHPELFKNYESIKKLKVKFIDGKEHSAKTEFPKRSDLKNYLNEVKITITLNLSYYHENKKEFNPLGEKNPEDSREAILLHELQHVLSSAHNRSGGITKFEASSKADARLDALRSRKKIKGLNEKESNELQFYASLKKKLLHDYFYYSNLGEIEARNTVREWLEEKGYSYLDPLTEFYGIHPEYTKAEHGFKVQYGVNPTQIKPYFLLTKEEVISERDRIETTSDKMCCCDSERIKDLARYSYTKFKTLLKELK